jgi:hypothetical protein
MGGIRYTDNGCPVFGQSSWANHPHRPGRQPSMLYCIEIAALSTDERPFPGVPDAA